MLRQFVFLVVVLSLSVSWEDRFAGGFSVVSKARMPSPKSTQNRWENEEGSQIVSLWTNERKRRKIQDGRNGRTILFSKTTETPWFCHEASAPKKTSNKSQSTPKSSPSPLSTNSTRQSSKKFNAAKFAVTEGPDPSTKPDYENIHGPLGKTLDKLFLYVFRTKLAEHVGVDSKLPKTDFNGLMELTVAMNARYSDRAEIQEIAQRTLRSLFPSWLPGQFAILFSKPFPEFSSRLNAWATYMAGQWLMGECEINDIEVDGKIMKDQGLLVKRCRFLEESGCASVCVNSCKIPTQKFFIEDMGLPLTMTPDYETHECQFSFGRMPTQQDDLDAMGTPCLSRCPTAGSMRQWHNGSGSKVATTDMASGEDMGAFLNTETSPTDAISQCMFMETTPPQESGKQVLPFST